MNLTIRSVPLLALLVGLSPALTAISTCGQECLTYYPDIDQDGWGDSAQPHSSCDPIDGEVTQSGDCNDADAGINPAMAEVCDGVDQDCDAQIDDEAVDPSTWYQDLDGDGYGTDAATMQGCQSQTGYAGNASDCNDGNAEISPAAPEQCNFIDDNCNGEVDEGFDGSESDCPPRIVLNVDTQNVQLAALLGYPEGAVLAQVVIEEGVTISSSDAAEPALSTVGLDPASTIYLVNRGLIHGRGGDGACMNAGAGENGGDAIQSTVSLQIDNSDGDIYGGGGGGGAGDDPAGGGGGAGGGLGCGGGYDADYPVLGVGGDGPSRFGTIPGGDGANYDGSPGTGGAVGNPGTSGGGGSGGAASLVTSVICCDGQGGAGGGWGGGGGGGTAFGTERNPGPGGNGGFAVRVLDGTITWLSGYNLSQVKGEVD